MARSAARPAWTSTTLAAAPGPSPTWRATRAAGFRRRFGEDGLGRTARRCSSPAPATYATQVRQGLEATLSGAGSVELDDLTGPDEGARLGVGHIKVADGHARTVHASVSGVGSVDFGGDAETLDASISGFGGIRVKVVNGSVTESVSGGGPRHLG